LAKANPDWFGICLVTALVLLLSGYDGYAGVTLGVAIAAGINLF